MGFTEVTFFFAFMPLSIILYLLAERLFHNDKVNNSILVAFSLLFYYWASKESLVVFLAIVIFTYMAGLSAAPGIAGEKQKNRAAFPIVLLIGVLVFYKYVTLMVTWINGISKLELIKIEELIVPIGLSFVVFESISYIVDIYRGDVEAGSLLDCFTFLSLFPKLVSGPIILWKDFKDQLTNRRVSLEKISGGIDRIIIGYAKKAIIADTFGLQITEINNGISSSGVDMPTMWLKGLLYFFQLYFDFSGYSDIAIGLADVFGFTIKENFNYPYLSRSISEFWRRWHISLGSWFREYVYIPLGGNRKHVYLNLFIVFILTGVWHGQGWNFLIWGGINGACVVFERAIKDKDWYKKIPGFLKWVITASIIYMLWIVFSSGDLDAATQFYSAMFKPMSAQVNFTWIYYLSNRTKLFLLIVIIGHVFGVDRVNQYVKNAMNTTVGAVIKKVLLISLFIIDVLYVVNSSYSPFMYFQF